MSKIGRKFIDVSNLQQIEVKGQEVHFKGPKSSGIYILPAELKAIVQDKTLMLTPAQEDKKGNKEVNRVWGLHRALLSGQLEGAVKEFEKEVKITGLGYKAVQSGGKLVFSLGYSHKIDFVLPEGVSVAIDKSGQNLIVKSSNKALGGLVASKIRQLRTTEPYKGTGIRFASDVVLRKAGKAKGA